MKLAGVFVIVVTIWSCSGGLDDQTTTTLSGGADSDNGSYLIGITMKKEDSSTKEVALIVYRNAGIPTCVGVRGIDTDDDLYVPLKKSGSGEWKGNNVEGTYERYGNADDADKFVVTLHWTSNMGVPNSGAENLEYFSANHDNSGLYEYQNDVDGKLGSSIGELSETTPSGGFRNNCPTSSQLLFWV